MAIIPDADVEGDPATAAAAAQVRGLRDGDLLNLYRTLLHSPPVATGWLQLATALRYGSTLPDGLRELLICHVAAATGCGYEWAQHVGLARGAGVTGEQLAALPRWRDQGVWSARETAALTVADAVLVHQALPGGARTALSSELGDTGLVELVALVTFYAGLAGFLLAFEVEVEPERVDDGAPWAGAHGTWDGGRGA